jgi:hypothetical protein
VFPTEAYQELYDAAAEALAAGKPAIHRATYTVMANSRQAVPGGWKVGWGLLPAAGRSAGQVLPLATSADDTMQCEVKQNMPQLLLSLWLLQLDWCWWPAAKPGLAAGTCAAVSSAELEFPHSWLLHTPPTGGCAVAAQHQGQGVGGCTARGHTVPADTP